MKIGINAFVLRQTAESKFSHYRGSWDNLVVLAEDHFDEHKVGYRDGVVLVPVPTEGFYSGVVNVTPETQLRATFEARRKDEGPYIQVVALGGDKLPAAVVEVVLYRRDVLLEEGPNAVSTEAEWEIVSINARPSLASEPLTPMTMARNFLAMAGGTKADYTAAEFAEAIIYWSKRAMRG